MNNLSHLFPKGQSGNPGGLTSEQAQMARSFRYKCAREADKRLPLMLEILDDRDISPAVRLSVWTAISDRGYGKSVQHLMLDEEKDSKRPEMMTKAELESCLAGDVKAAFRSMYQRGELSDTIAELEQEKER